MTLSQILKPELILTKVACASKDELLSILVERVYSLGLKTPISQEDLMQALLKREEIGGTLLPSGLIVPHARLKDHDDENFIIAMGIPLEPLFQDNQKIRMMALMVSSQLGGPYYLRSLAALTRISRDEEFFNRLCKAETPEDFLNLLNDKDTELN